jgi:FKBP-type peptidyl-prolyl cis-trans isomerase
LDSISYLIGADIGHNLLNNSIEFKAELLFKGIEDAIKNIDSLTVSTQKKNECLGKWQQDRSKKLQEEKAKKSEGAKIAGAAFLEKNKTAEGVKVTASGLQYKVIKEGSGEHPKATDKVKVHYHGTLIDGTVFDSSVQRGEPISFGLNQVIPGWTEGVQLMTPGSKYIFYIPSNLAYGDREAGKIPPGSTLIFEVELFNIEAPTEK